MPRFIALTLVILSWCAGAAAQCELTIHVRTDDREFNDHVQVEILSTGGTPISTGQTNQDGVATFQVSSGVTYVLHISGQGIEPVTTEFFIMGGQPSHTENINVKRTVSADTQNAASATPTISVAEMNVPGKARDEMQKGMEAMNKGDMAKAQQRFEKAVAIYPQYARAYASLGVLAAKSGDRTKARDLYSKAIAVDDKFLPAYINMARLDFQDKNYTAAESLLGKVMLLNPSMPDAVSLLASTEYANKEYDRALADAQRVHLLPHHEQYANMHLLAGQILETQNRAQEAIVEYRMFLKEEPGSPQAPMVQRAITDLQSAKH